MLLLDVEVDIAPEKDAILAEWYATHVPHLMAARGYRSARRYAALTRRPRYLALYEIEDESHVPSLLGSDIGLRDPLTLVDGPPWLERVEPNVDYFRFGVFRPDDAGLWPILDGDRTVVHARFDLPEGDDGTIDATLRRALVPELSRSRDVARALVLSAVRGDHIMWIGRDENPARALLVQVAGEAAALAAADDLRARLDALGVANLHVDAYRPFLHLWSTWD